MEPNSPSGFRDPKITFKGFIHHVCILDLAYYYYFTKFCDIGCSEYHLMLMYRPGIWRGDSEGLVSVSVCILLYGSYLSVGSWPISHLNSPWVSEVCGLRITERAFRFYRLRTLRVDVCE
jgi:hypothetical protein